MNLHLCQVLYLPNMYKIREQTPLCLIRILMVWFFLGSSSLTLSQSNPPNITRCSFEYRYSWSKKKKIPISFNMNYRREVKLVPIIIDYCLLQFDALKFFLRVRLHGKSLSNFNFLNVNPQIFQWNRKVHLSNCQ